MNFDQLSRFSSAFFPDDTTFQSALMLLAGVNRCDFSGSTTPSGSGGGTGCSMLDFGASRSTGGISGIGWAVFSSGNMSCA